MKRFVQIMSDVKGYVDDSEREDFENRCSCAIACGYVPCGSTFQSSPVMDKMLKTRVRVKASGEDADLIEVATEKNYTLFSLFMIRTGRRLPSACIVKNVNHVIRSRKARYFVRDLKMLAMQRSTVLNKEKINVGVDFQWFV